MVKKTRRYHSSVSGRNQNRKLATTAVVRHSLLEKMGESENAG